MTLSQRRFKAWLMSPASLFPCQTLLYEHLSIYLSIYLSLRCCFYVIITIIFIIHLVMSTLNTAIWIKDRSLRRKNHQARPPRHSRHPHLTTALKIPTIKRIIITSSIAAIVGSNPDTIYDGTHQPPPPQPNQPPRRKRQTPPHQPPSPPLIYHHPAPHCLTQP